MTSGADMPMPPAGAGLPPVNSVPPEPKPNALQRIVGAIIAPSATFASIARRPDFAVILVLYVLLGIVSSITMVKYIDFESGIREQMESTNRNMKPEDIDRSVRFGAAAAKGIMYASPILSLAVYAIIAGVLLIAFRAMGGEGTFLQAFSVTLYAWVPMMIKGLLMLVILISRGTVGIEELNNLVISNLGFLVDMKEQKVLYALLSSFDLFTFWTLALMVIGFSYVAKMTKSRAAAIVLFLWAFVVFLKVGMAALGAAAAGANRS